MINGLGKAAAVSVKCAAGPQTAVGMPATQTIAKPTGGGVPPVKATPPIGGPNVRAGQMSAMSLPPAAMKQQNDLSSFLPKSPMPGKIPPPTLSSPASGGGIVPPKGMMPSGLLGKAVNL